MTPKRRLNIRSFTYHFFILTKGNCGWQAKKGHAAGTPVFESLVEQYPIAL
jgi:hypothetical protein